jgi:selenocysteine lyase/cysteine desulfurase
VCLIYTRKAIYAHHNKWLSAPKGAGFLYARPDVQFLLKPLVVSWGYESEQPGSSQFVDHHEWWGTRDLTAFLSVPDAIEFQQKHDWDKVRAACHELVRGRKFVRVSIQGYNTRCDVDALVKAIQIWLALEP